MRAVAPRRRSSTHSENVCDSVSRLSTAPSRLSVAPTPHATATELTMLDVALPTDGGNDAASAARYGWCSHAMCTQAVTSLPLPSAKVASANAQPRNGRLPGARAMPSSSSPSGKSSASAAAPACRIASSLLACVSASRSCDSTRCRLSAGRGLSYDSRATRPPGVYGRPKGTPDDRLSLAVRRAVSPVHTRALMAAAAAAASGSSSEAAAAAAVAAKEVVPCARDSCTCRSIACSARLRAATAAGDSGSDAPMPACRPSPDIPEPTENIDSRLP